MTDAARPPTAPAAAELLSIGRVSDRTGVPASTLRYYDELGLIRPAARRSGQRRYAATAVRDVGLIVVLQQIGFSLAEIRLFRTGVAEARRALVKQKLAELAVHRHRLEVASRALEHGLECPAPDHLQCPRFWSIIEGCQRGQSIEESHARAHRRRPRPAGH